MGRKLGPLSTSFRVDTSKIILESNKLSAAVKSPKMQRIIKYKLAELERKVRAEVATELAVVGDSEAEKLRNKADFAFQATPSYIGESAFGLPGRKRYPEGTIGTFSTQNDDLEGSFWGERTQKYIKGTHFLRDRVTSNVSQSRVGEVSLEVGYPKLTARQNRIATWVLFGTDKMQPRPFLTIAHARAIRSRLYQRAVYRAVNRVGGSL